MSEQLCPACHGKIRARPNRMEQVIANHQVSCPARGVSRKKGEPDEEAAVPDSASQ